MCTPADSGDNTIAAAAVNVAEYHIPVGTPTPIVAVITFALAQLGKPYVYGATGPNAWDCSGLVQGAYARIGVRLPRTTFDQVNVGSPVYSINQLQPGDLLFISGSDGTPEAPRPRRHVCGGVCVFFDTLPRGGQPAHTGTSVGRARQAQPPESMGRLDRGDAPYRVTRRGVGSQ